MLFYDRHGIIYHKSLFIQKEIIMYYKLFAFILIIGTAQCTNHIESKKYTAHIAHEIAKTPLSFEQSTLLLNILYYMHQYTQYETMYKMATIELYRAQPSLYANEHGDSNSAFISLQQEVAKVQLAATKQAEYLRIWQSLDAHIDHSDPDLAQLLSRIQEAGQYLINEYINQTADYMDSALIQQEANLSASARSIHALARIVGVLVTSPDTFYPQNNDKNIQKLNMMQTMHTSIQKNIATLVHLQNTYIKYIQDAQESAAQLFCVIYQASYQQTKKIYPSHDIKQIIITPQGLMYGTDLLPDALEALVKIHLQNL